MFKVISSEIKKILSKPSIYVLAIILAVILVLGVFIYKPTAQTTTVTTLNGSTYTDKYDDFTNSTGGIKKVVNSNINSSIIQVNNYIEIVNYEQTTKQEYINNLFSNVETAFNSYRNCANDNSESNWINQQKSNLINSINVLDSEIVTNIASATQGSYALLTTNDNYENYLSTIKSIKTWANVSVEKAELANHCGEFEKNLKPQLKSCLNSFIYPILSQQFITSYTTTNENTNLSIIYARLNEINERIETNYELAKTTEETNTQMASTMDYLANLYLNTANTYLNLLKYELLSNAFNFASTSEAMGLMHLKDYSSYNINSLKIKYEYLFKNNEVEQSFANPLTIGATSNGEINAYDYAYFILKLFSFVIVAYSVMTACHSIAGEIKEGSMRYLAIRPVSRTQLYFGKLFAILILSSILIVFSGVISLFVGSAVYGFNSLNILTVFNGTSAIVVHPIVMLAIFLLSLIIEVVVYSSIAFLVSALFKSDLFAVTIVLLLYLINTLLPMFVQGANTWLSFYPFSHISLYPLFGSAVYANNNFFNLLLGAKVYATTNIGLTIVMVILITVIINFITTQIFRYKEL